LARPARPTQVRVFDLAHELVAAQRDFQVGAVRLRPAPAVVVLEAHHVEAERGPRRAERVPDRRTSTRHETGLVRATERQLVLCGAVPCGIEAPPVPRRLVDETQAGGAYRKRLLGQLRRVDGPRERRTVDDVPEAE